MTNPEERKGDQFWLRVFSLECIQFASKAAGTHATTNCCIDTESPARLNMKAFHLSVLSGHFFFASLRYVCNTQIRSEVIRNQSQLDHTCFPGLVVDCVYLPGF